ncbi:MAG: serine/threonine protein kinase, partial [Polyangiaceae bacterium]
DAPVTGELGKYRLIAEIARGGMGIVYLALMPGPGGFYKTLVVKELKPDYAHDRSFLAMFLDEARVAAKLHHPNIVQVYEVDNVADRYFIAMEYLEGCTMRRALKLLKTDFPVGMVVAALVEVLRGLHHAHELADEAGESMGLVHRDMSPHNIFLTFEGQAKIVDFGIVKTRDSQHTEVGVFKGKVAYMPPEQAMPDVTVDRRADIYAVGVILFEALTGQRLWTGMQEVHILASLMKGDIPSIEKVKPSVPAELKRICSKAMAWNRDDRYATAEEFREDLEQYYEQARLSVTIRDVGSLLARSLETERAKMKTLVDRKIAKLKEGGGHEKVSILPPPSSTPQLDADQSGSISGFYEERDPA